MIINVGARGDIAACYPKWLNKRIEEGYVLVRNPFCENAVTRYELSPNKVDCILFCSKNYAPALSFLPKIVKKYGTYFFYTITPYGKDVEPNVPSVNKSIQTLKDLWGIVGKDRLCWRYDPILLTKKYTRELHLLAFEKMAAEISKYTKRCVFSFVEMYKKTQINMPEIIPITYSDKIFIGENMGKIAKKYGLTLQICGSDEDFSRFGIEKSGCATLEILGRANGVSFKELKHRGMRKGCRCIESRDIGAYDSCTNGCKYCYANQNPVLAKKNFANHSENSPLLLGELKKGDIIKNAKQESFLKEDNKQLKLF